MELFHEHGSEVACSTPSSPLLLLLHLMRGVRVELQVESPSASPSCIEPSVTQCISDSCEASLSAPWLILPSCACLSDVVPPSFDTQNIEAAACSRSFVCAYKRGSGLLFTPLL